MMRNLYGGKYKLDFLPTGHKYLVNGQKKPGVTSILAILNKPGIPQWASNKSVEWIRNETVPFPEYEGKKAWIVTDEDLNRARTAYLRSRDTSADVGKRVHAWVEKHIKNAIKGQSSYPPYEDDMRPSIESFIKWEEEYRPTYLFSERIIFSEKGDYCGTTDVCLVLENDRGEKERVILDFKTGKPEREFDKRFRRYTNRVRPYSSVFIQDALYDLAIEEEDGIRADKFGALYLSTNGELLFGLTDETDSFREAGMSIVAMYHGLQKVNMLNKWIDK